LSRSPLEALLITTIASRRKIFSLSIGVCLEHHVRGWAPSMSSDLSDKSPSHHIYLFSSFSPLFHFCIVSFHYILSFSLFLFIYIYFLPLLFFSFIIMTIERSICVFCGSGSGNKQSFTAAAADLGKELANKNWGLVYGGGTTG
jgi:hypothetical protein